MGKLYSATKEAHTPIVKMAGKMDLEATIAAEVEMRTVYTQFPWVVP